MTQLPHIPKRPWSICELNDPQEFEASSIGGVSILDGDGLEVALIPVTPAKGDTLARETPETGADRTQEELIAMSRLFRTAPRLQETLMRVLVYAFTPGDKRGSTTECVEDISSALMASTGMTKDELAEHVGKAVNDLPSTGE